ncbi:MAG: FecR family protein, partial [Ignavibacteriales bacterium]
MIDRADHIADARTDTAVDWLMRRMASPLSEAETRAFEAWLTQSPDNAAAYEEVDKIWRAAAAVESHPRVEARRRWVLRSAGRPLLARRAVAAVLVAAVLGGAGLGLNVLIGPRPLATQSFRTAVGQQATVTLPDGSVVTLNTDTVVRTRADGDRRLVYLDKGQAFFKVAHDRRHPFVVTAAGRTVTALGTAFDVRVDRGALKVVLVEGKVRVESTTRPPATPVATTAGAPAQAAAQQATEMSAG